MQRSMIFPKRSTLSNSVGREQGRWRIWRHDPGGDQGEVQPAPGGRLGRQSPGRFDLATAFVKSAAVAQGGRPRS